MINALRSRQNGRNFTDDIFKCIFLNEQIQISINISLKFVPNGQINNILALIEIMAWYWPGNKPLSEPVMVSLPMHICITWPQSVKDVDYSCDQLSIVDDGINQAAHLSFKYLNELISPWTYMISILQKIVSRTYPLLTICIFIGIYLLSFYWGSLLIELN